MLAHRQAFCWTDEWYDKPYESIVEYERDTYGKTNERVVNAKTTTTTTTITTTTANGGQPSPKTTTPAAMPIASSEKNIADFD